MRAAILVLALTLCVPAVAAPPKIPIIHSTDLFHPHTDPDDHYDLACLFAIAEFDIRGVVLDLGETQAQRTGRPAVEQMMHITGRRVPCAIGLSQRLRTRTDKALEEPTRFQAGVNLILSVLRDSREKVVLFTTGSCRDVAVAFNRQPELLRQKVRAIYFNIGRGPNEPQEECNVGYDPQSYLRLFESGLPIYWCPCFGKGGYETLYVAEQKTVVGQCTPAVQNFFVYCLTHSKAEPLGFLASGAHPLPTGLRSMWCTAPMFHAAGRKIYQRGSDDFVALAPEAAEKAGLAGKEVVVFGFEPMRSTIEPEQAEIAVKPAEPPPGQISAAYAGRAQDRVGTAEPQPDGRADCRVRVLGVKPQPAIANVVLTGPHKGRWESIATGRWWRVIYECRERQLDGFFQFWAPGQHQIEIVYADRSRQSATFEVPNVATAGLCVDLKASPSNGFVFRATDARYKQIMASCLKNLLSGLGR